MNTEYTDEDVKNFREAVDYYGVECASESFVDEYASDFYKDGEGIPWEEAKQKAEEIVEQLQREIGCNDNDFYEPFDDGYTATHRWIENWSPRGW